MIKIKDETEFIATAKTRFKAIADFEAEARDLQLEDLRVAYRNPWDPDAFNKRDGEGRPTPIVRRSKQFLDHIKNEQRQNKPQIKVSPVDEGAQEKEADRRRGTIRHIHYESKAAQAIQRAFDFAVDIGRGWFRITTDYVHGKSNDQKISIESIRDQFSVYMDEKHEELDYSDCRWGFVLNRIRRDEYEEMYPGKNKNEWTSSSRSVWVEKDFITLVEYYLKGQNKRELIRIEQDGVEVDVYRDELNDDISDDKIISKRWVEDDYVCWYLLSETEILEKKETVFKNIPLIPIICEETDIDGTYDCKGVMRDLKDLTKAYNFLVAQEFEIIQNSPITPFVGAVGQFQNLKNQWGDNSSARAYREYNPVSHNGQLVPPPQRADFVSVPQGIVQAKLETVSDMQAVTGFYDAQAGNRSNETSGIAIRQRVNQGNTASYHLPDNADIALTHGGRIINDALDEVYTPGRVVTIMGEDDEKSKFEIGGVGDDGKIQGLGDGQFSVVVSVGPSYNTKREEAVANMIETSKANPIVSEAAGDLMIKAQDWPLKDEIAERIKRLMDIKYPNGILTAPISEDGDDRKLAEMAQQLQQMSGEMEKIMAEREQLMAQLQKIDQQKNATESRKVEKDLKELAIKEKELILKTKEIDLKSQELEIDAKKADLNAETDIRKSHIQSETQIAVAQIGVGRKQKELEDVGTT